MKIIILLIGLFLILFESNIFGQKISEYRLAYTFAAFSKTVNSGISDGIYNTDRFDSVGVNLQCVSAPSISIAYQKEIGKSNFYWGIEYRAQSLHYQSTVIQHYYNPNSISPPTSEINLYNRMNEFSFGFIYRLNFFKKKLSVDLIANTNYRYFKDKTSVTNKFIPQTAVGEYGYETKFDFSPVNKKIVFGAGIRLNFRISEHYGCFSELKVSERIYAGYSHKYEEIMKISESSGFVSTQSVIINDFSLQKRTGFYQFGFGFTYSIPTKK